MEFWEPIDLSVDVDVTHLTYDAYMFIELIYILYITPCIISTSELRSWKILNVISAQDPHSKNIFKPNLEASLRISIHVFNTCHNPTLLSLFWTGFCIILRYQAV